MLSVIAVQIIKERTAVLWQILSRCSILALLVTAVFSTTLLGHDLNADLSAAAATGQSTKVKELIEAGADVNHVGTVNFGRPLLVAAQFGHAEVVRILLDAGADIEAECGNIEYSGFTALDFATNFCHEETVRALLEVGANVHAKGPQKGTPLMMTCWGAAGIARDLLAAGADVNARSVDGLTALTITSAVGDVDVVRVLLEAGADVNAKEDSGQTALIWASKNGHVETVVILLEHGADASAKDNTGRTALIWAEVNGHQDIANFLKKRELKQ